MMTGGSKATGVAVNAPNGSKIPSPIAVANIRRDRVFPSCSSEVIDSPRKRTSSVNATASRMPALSPAMKAKPSTKPSMNMSMPVAASMANGPDERSSSALIASMTPTPTAPPIRVAVGEASCLIWGRISTAAAAKTTPAARCCVALTKVVPGRRKSAQKVPISTAPSGSRV